MKVCCAGGRGGGAKLAHGLSLILVLKNFTVVVNTGDDFQHLGLHISPDLDTVIVYPGWPGASRHRLGSAGETWNFLEALKRLGGDTCFG